MPSATGADPQQGLPTVFTVRDDGVKERIVCCGGVYSNAHALRAFLAWCDAAGVPRTDAYCLGDLTGFGPHPARTLEILRDSGIHVLQGNHDYSLAMDAGGCGCGYAADSGDAYWSQLSFDYTVRHTPAEWKPWLGSLPHQANVRLADGRRVRLCHGSPRVMNEFLFESLPDDFYRARLAETDADMIVCTHTGLPWTREVAPGKWIVNCGVLGRPANDGRQSVWFAELRAGTAPALHTLDYDWPAQAAEMAAAGLPAEFVTTIRQGWWACCYEILPPAEKARGKYSALAAPSGELVGNSESVG